MHSRTRSIVTHMSWTGHDERARLASLAFDGIIIQIMNVYECNGANIFS